MIVNFYKRIGVEWRRDQDYKVIASKNIECIPQKGTFIKLSGQLFIVDRIYFDMYTCEYSIYIIRA